MPTGVYTRTEEHKRILRDSAWNKGKKLSDEHKKRIGLGNKGKKHTKEQNELVSLRMSKRVGDANAFYGKKHTEESKEKMRIARLGKYGKENHWNWQGGISTKRDQERHCDEMTQWRKELLNKYNNTCQKCGDSKTWLHAHHIENFATCYEKRTDINNGIIFCKKCHEDFHKIYTRNNNSMSQVNEYITQPLTA